MPFKRTLLNAVSSTRNARMKYLIHVDTLRMLRILLWKVGASVGVTFLSLQKSDNLSSAMFCADLEAIRITFDLRRAEEKDDENGTA